VLDLGDAWASPFASTLLADAGAGVIRIEDIHRQLSNTRGPVAPRGPLEGYADNDPGERPFNRYFLYNSTERNKRGITLDLNHARARELFEELVRRSDIFTTNYSVAAVASLHVRFEDLRRINPSIVYAHVTGYGCDGPMSVAPAVGSTVDAWVGHMSVRGYPDTAPHDTEMIYQPDAVGALTLSVALMAALRARATTGDAQCVEVALSECLIPFLAQPLLQAEIDGEPPAPWGNRHPEWAPQGVYPVAGDDRWIAISARDDAEWRELAACLGLDADAYPAVAARHEQHDALDRDIAAATAGRDGFELMRALQERRVPAMMLYLDSELYADRALTGGDFLQEATHPDSGTRLYPGPLWRSQNRPMRLRVPHAGLGEHNRDVLCGELGVSDEEFARLEAEEAIGDYYTFWPRPVMSGGQSPRRGA
jgi:crotonobetainyl-CoA:carnitine CoA-transferase CaiB-like acyl-CoA transferase